MKLFNKKTKLDKCLFSLSILTAVISINNANANDNDNKVKHSINNKKAIEQPNNPANTFVSSQATTNTSTTSSKADASNAVKVKSIDGIAAIVNNNVITKRELIANANSIQQQLKNAGKNINVSQQDFLKEILERLINDKVQLQRARDIGVNLSDAEIISLIKATAAKNNMTLEQYVQAIEKTGVNIKQWKEDAINNIVLDRLRQKEVEPKVKVSEAEIDSYISSLVGVTVSASEEFNISRVFIPNTGKFDQETLNKETEKANEILANILNNNISFEQAMKYYSKAKEASSASSISIANTKSLPSEVLTVLLRMQRQQIWPEVIKTKDGYYILRLNDKIVTNKQVRQEAVEIPQTKVRQILIRVAGTTSEKDAKQRLSELKKKIEAGEDMASLASLYSQDGSAMNGGSMNWVSLGEMVPEFEQAMNVLAVGKVSDPVRTDYGYHLIQVLERRVKTVAVSQQREEARNVLKERKTEIVYQDWVKDLRTRAFVDYKVKF